MSYVIEAQFVNGETRKMQGNGQWKVSERSLVMTDQDGVTYFPFELKEKSAFSSSSPTWEWRSISYEAERSAWKAAWGSPSQAVFLRAARCPPSDPQAPRSSGSSSAAGLGLGTGVGFVF